MGEKVIHYRFFDRVSKRLSSTGGITVAYAVTTSGLEFAFSECSIRDHYCKSIGVALASARLSNKTSCYKFIPLEGILADLCFLSNIKNLLAIVDITKFLHHRFFKKVIDVYVDQYLEVLYGGKYYGATFSNKERHS